MDGSVAGVSAFTCGTFVLIQVALLLVLARPPADTPYITHAGLPWCTPLLYILTLPSLSTLHPHPAPPQPAPLSLPLPHPHPTSPYPGYASKQYLHILHRPLTLSTHTLTYTFHSAPPLHPELGLVRLD